MGAQERLDMMLNDALCGIIFRDINVRYPSPIRDRLA